MVCGQGYDMGCGQGYDMGCGQGYDDMRVWSGV